VQEDADHHAILFMSHACRGGKVCDARAMHACGRKPVHAVEMILKGGLARKRKLSDLKHMRHKLKVLSSKAMIIVLQAGVATAVPALSSNGASALPAGCTLDKTCNSSARFPGGGKPKIPTHQNCAQIKDCKDPSQNSSQTCGDWQDGECPLER